MPSDPSSSADPPDRPRSDADGGDADAPPTEADVERIARRVVREELDARDRRGGSIWTLLAGVVAGLFVLLPLSGVVSSSLANAGVPIELLAVGWLLVAAALVAYGWRLPPFR